ncbi:MAG: uroporphyrinogen-III synthase [Gammaproteobacteria bacterium]
MNAVAGKHVLVTRSDEDSAEWASRLEAAGANAVVLPCIRCVPIESDELRNRIADLLPDTDWLVFTSKRGVAAFTDLTSAEIPPGAKITVVGPATADAAVVAFCRADLVSEAGTAASLAQAIEARLDTGGNNVVLGVAENAGSTIEDALAGAGANCTRLDVYRTIPAGTVEPKFTLTALGADTIFLASPSAVEGLTNQVELDKPAAIFTIGPATNAAAKAAGLEVTGQARRPGIEGLMEAMQCEI